MYDVTGYYQVQHTQTITVGRYLPTSRAEQVWQISSVELGQHATLEAAHAAACTWHAQYADDLQAATTIQHAEDRAATGSTPSKIDRLSPPPAKTSTWTLRNPRPEGLTTTQLLHAWQLDSVPTGRDVISFTRDDTLRIRVAGRTLRQLLTLHKDAVWTWTIPDHDYDGSIVSPSSVTIIMAKATTYLELTLCTPDTPRPTLIHLVDNPYTKGRIIFVQLAAKTRQPLLDATPINPNAYQQASLFG